MYDIMRVKCGVRLFSRLSNMGYDIFRVMCGWCSVLKERKVNTCCCGCYACNMAMDVLEKD